MTGSEFQEISRAINNLHERVERLEELMDALLEALGLERLRKQEHNP